MFRDRVRLVVVLLFMLIPLAIVAGEQVSPEAISGATTIDTTTAKHLFDHGAVFIDVRNDADWEVGRIPGALHMDLEHTLTTERLSAAVPDKAQGVVMYCNGPKCLRSSAATAKAVAWGFTTVYYYRLGFPAWQGAGYPVE